MNTIAYTPEHIKSLLEVEKNIYFIGIGGVSMSCLAEISANSGIRAGGSDRALSARTAELISEGIEVFEGHDAAHCKNYTLFVYNAAIHPDNPEYAYAEANGYPLIRRSEYLGYIITFYKNSVGIAGTHGKSTTTAMTGMALYDAGLDPTVLNGAVIAQLGTSFIHGGRDYLCFEACEYTDSFLSFFPTVAVVLNAELDHVDYFGNFERYLLSFEKYLSQSPYAVVNIDSPGAEKAAFNYKGKLLTCAVDKHADVCADNIVFSGAYPEFDIIIHNKLYCHAAPGVGGMHNVYNTLCCAAVCYLFGIDGSILSDSLTKFKGASRRFEKKFEFNGAEIYDDYAHHPSEIKATLKEARAMTRGRLYTVFQPHTYSRTRDLYPDFLTAFKACDEVIFADIYPARETDTLGMSAQKLANDVENGKYTGDFSQIAEYLKAVLTPGDTAVIMGAGDVGGVLKYLDPSASRARK